MDLTTPVTEELTAPPSAAACAAPLAPLSVVRISSIVLSPAGVHKEGFLPAGVARVLEMLVSRMLFGHSFGLVDLDACFDTENK